MLLYVVMALHCAALGAPFDEAQRAVAVAPGVVEAIDHVILAAARAALAARDPDLPGECGPR